MCSLQAFDGLSFTYGINSSTINNAFRQVPNDHPLHIMLIRLIVFLVTDALVRILHMWMYTGQSCASTWSLYITNRPGRPLGQMARVIQFISSNTDLWNARMIHMSIPPFIWMFCATETMIICPPVTTTGPPSSHKLCLLIVICTLTYTVIMPASLPFM